MDKKQFKALLIEQFTAEQKTWEKVSARQDKQRPEYWYFSGKVQALQEVIDFIKGA